MSFNLTQVQVCSARSSKHLQKDASFVTLKTGLLNIERQKPRSLLYEKGKFSYCVAFIIILGDGNFES
jgi:hypothetical protein